MTDISYSEDWNEISKAIREEANYICQKCGRIGIKPGEKQENLTRSQRMAYTVQVHHWNRNSLDNRKENLVCLCSSLCRIHVVETLMGLTFRLRLLQRNPR